MTVEEAKEFLIVEVMVAFTKIVTGTEAGGGG